MSNGKIHPVTNKYNLYKKVYQSTMPSKQLNKRRCEHYIFSFSFSINYRNNRLKKFTL